jgi:hypothetical protein
VANIGYVSQKNGLKTNQLKRTLEVVLGQLPKDVKMIKPMYDPKKKEGVQLVYFPTLDLSLEATRYLNIMLQ